MKTSLLLLCVSLLTACSVTTPPSAPPHAFTLTTNATVDGFYEMSGQPITEQGRNGQNCQVHFGTMRIHQGVVSGNIIHVEPRIRMDFNAHIGANGEMQQGLGYAGEIFGNWQGLFGDNSGQGVWRDNSDCSGIWFATRVHA